MQHKTKFEDMRIDIQTVNADISNKIRQHIVRMIKRLKRHIHEINWVDIYFKSENNRSLSNRSVGIRLGIPGNDAFASESGIHWIPLLKNVETKLGRQLRKRKK